MWLEPQGYALQIPEMPQERKPQLFAAVEKRLIDGETLGARQKEKPTVYDVKDLPSRERVKTAASGSR